MPILAILCLLVGVSSAQRQEAIEACKAMNFSVKASLMRGFGEIDGYSRNSGCGGICGRATFRWDNGPQGFGDNAPPGSTTQWPASLSIAATFDPDLALEWGIAMGEEFWGKGTNIQEGPGVNVARVMRNGRNFEYMSGEDPVLGALMLPNVVQGIQQSVMSITVRTNARTRIRTRARAGSRSHAPARTRLCRSTTS
jgi:beta-glucosidase